MRKILQWRVKRRVPDVFTGKLVPCATIVPSDLAWTELTPTGIFKLYRHGVRSADGKDKDSTLEFRWKP